MDLDGVEQIDTNAVGGADALTVNDVSGTDLTGVRADLAADGHPDAVTAVGTNGTDAISVAGSAGPTRCSERPETTCCSEARGSTCWTAAPETTSSSRTSRQETDPTAALYARYQSDAG
jgi:hypothetical protein